MKSYITLAELDTYVKTEYSSIELTQIGWNALTPADKQVFMDKAMRAIESLPYRGDFVGLKQELQFPRVLYDSYGSTKYLFPINITQNDLGVIGVPELVKKAVAVMAVVCFQDVTDSRKKMLRLGLKQIRRGDEHEIYADTVSLVNEVVPPWVIENYLKRWYLGGGSLG